MKSARLKSNRCVSSAPDSALSEMRDLHELLQAALTDSENHHARRDKRDRETVAAMVEVRQALTDRHDWQCASAYGDDCTCGTVGLLARLDALIGERRDYLTELDAERAEMKSLFQKLRGKTDE